MKYVIYFAGVCAPFILSNFSYASDFIDDTKISITARNYYLDRNYVEEAPYPAARDWAQGFILKAQSGYTSGDMGVGLDFMANAGFKLYGSSDYAATGLLPANKVTNERANNYGEIGLTAKAKIFENTTVHVGTLEPKLPVLFASPARLFPQVYRGIQVQTSEIPNFHLNVVYVDRINHRDSTNYEHITLVNPNKRFNQAAESSGMHEFGGEYKLTDKTELSAYYANLHDVYQQTFLGVKGKKDTQFGQLLGDMRLFISNNEGKALAGNIDNQHFSGIWGIHNSNHTFSIGYMQSFGETALPYLSGGEPMHFLDTLSTDLANINERVYHLRYDYDFKYTAANGLKFMTRYSKGDNIELIGYGQQHFKEKELDFELSYKVQQGIFKDLNLRARHSTYRNNMPSTMTFKPANELRLNIDYTWKF